MDARTLTAAGHYAAARPATKPDPNSGSAGELLKKSFNDFESTLRNGEQIAVQSMTNKADPHALVQALAQTELAVDTAIAVRNKVVEAYMEILRMPV